MRQSEANTGERRRDEGREWEEGETAHPSLGVHPSLESVCAVITVSNRWCLEERVCLCVLYRSACTRTSACV